MEEYRIYADEPPPLGEELEIRLQSVGTLQWLTTKAIIAQEPDPLKAPAKLWIYDAKGKGGLLVPAPWFVQVLETEEEEAPQVQVRPAQVSLRERRGDLLATLIRMQEEKEKQKEQG